jgi:hypothetical protein
MVWPQAHPHQKAPYGMTKEIWNAKGCSFGKFYGYIKEKTTGGKRIWTSATDGHPTIAIFHADYTGVDFVFANCRSCLGKDFSGEYKTGADEGMDIDDPNTPRLGRCGCVCCTECVLRMPEEEGWVGCPACGSAKFQHKNEIFWIINIRSKIRKT